MTDYEAPNPKFSVGEVVQVLTHTGEVFADNAELIDCNYVPNPKPGQQLINGRITMMAPGWYYDFRLYSGGSACAHEKLLRKRPQPGIQSWDELMDSLPKVRDGEVV